jgi:alkylhydroperoxidase family enzyme
MFSMTLVSTIPSQEDINVAEIHAEITQLIGRVPSALALYNVSPFLLRQQWDFLKHYFHHPSLSGALLAATRMCVSREFECEYCIGLNAGLLVEWFGWTPEQLAAFKLDPTDNPFGEKDRAMLVFAIKTVRAPLTVDAADLDGLRELGWSDADILEAATHAARNVSADILFNAFKIETDY